MINRGTNRLELGDIQEGPFQLLADLETIAAEPADLEPTLYTTKHRGDYIERQGYHDNDAFTPPEYLIHSRRDSFELIAARKRGQFHQLSIGGVGYLADYSLTKLCMRLPDGGRHDYWSFVYKSEVFAAIPDARERLARVVFGTDQFIGLPANVAQHVRYVPPVLDFKWLARPAPFNVPMKDMSAFDEGIVKMYGHARAAHLLKAIV